METFSILFGVPFWAVMTFLWFRHLRKTRAPLSKRVVGTLVILALPMLCALSLGKYMFIDEPLYFAAGEGDVPKAKALLAWGANPNIDFNGSTPLDAAAAQGSVEMVRLLIDHDASVSGLTDYGEVPQGTPLQLAQENGHKEVVRILKEAGARQ